MKTLALIIILSIGLSAKCLTPEYPKGSIDKDIAASFEEASKGIQVKLHTDNALTFEGTAKGSISSSSYTILLDKECSSSGECFKIRGFVASGDISALEAKIDSSKDMITIPSGTKFEIIKGDDERWSHVGQMPDCSESASTGRGINQKIIDSQMKPMNDAIKNGDL